jgi:predicted negative regulator of RcsB-dependent stress response
MTRHPTARKIHREVPESVLLERLLEANAWVREHGTIALGGAALVLLLAIGFAYFRYTSSALAERAAIQLFQLRSTAATGNPAITIRDAEAFLDRFGRTPSAVEAKLLLAQAQLESGQADQAIQITRSLADDLDTHPGVSAAFLLAAAYEMNSRYKEAEDVYLRIAEGAQFEFQKANALDAAAMLRLEQSNAAGAVELYDRLLRELPENSPDRPIYQMRRGEAAAAAGTG